MAAMTNTTDAAGATNKVEAPVRTKHLGRRALRGLARVTAVTLALLVGLAAAGAVYEAIAAGGDARAYPPPGRLVNVGGYNLHIQCVGAGSPTVVFESGLGGMSLDWSLVQGAIGQTTRVCAYDRAGMGWSEPGPQPRTPGRIAGDLHTLLTNAGIPGPYVLVGHSVGGKNVRMSALKYPEDVAGMVLVDATGESANSPPASASTQSLPQVTGSEWSLYGILRRVGLVRLIGASQWGPQTLSEQTRTELALFATGQRGLDATAAEYIGMAADNPQLQAASSLGHWPLIVLAADESVRMDPQWTVVQRHQAGMSTKGRLIVVAGSGHYIQLDQPEVVIDAVQQVVMQARGR